MSVTVTFLLLVVVSFLLQMRTKMIRIILMTKMIRKDFRKVMMKRTKIKMPPFHSGTRGARWQPTSSLC